MFLFTYFLLHSSNLTSRLNCYLFHIIMSFVVSIEILLIRYFLFELLTSFNFSPKRSNVMAKNVRFFK